MRFNYHSVPRVRIVKHHKTMLHVVTRYSHDHSLKHFNACNLLSNLLQQKVFYIIKFHETNLHVGTPSLAIYGEGLEFSFEKFGWQSQPLKTPAVCINIEARPAVVF